MKLCAGCSHEYNEDFKFCPECGRPFGGVEAENLQQEMNQHLLDMKQSAKREAAISSRVFSGSGLGDSVDYGRPRGR